MVSKIRGFFSGLSIWYERVFSCICWFFLSDFLLVYCSWNWLKRMHLWQLYFGFPVFDAIPLFAHDTLVVNLLLMKKAESFALSLYIIYVLIMGLLLALFLFVCAVYCSSVDGFYLIPVYDFLALVIITFLLAFLNLFEFRMHT